MQQFSINDSEQVSRNKSEGMLASAEQSPLGRSRADIAPTCLEVVRCLVEQGLLLVPQ